jgi:hypothetical protein
VSRDNTPHPHHGHPGRDSGDALLERYREANALDSAHPSPALREAVLAQARAAVGHAKARGELNPELIAEYDTATLGKGQNSSKSSIVPPPVGGRAANDTSWRIRAVASVAVLGLATLLFLQFERGTPGERELAMSPTPSAVPATAPTTGSAEQSASTAQSPDRAPPPASGLPAAAETPVPGQRPRDTQAPATPTNPKVAPTDKVRAEQGSSGIAPTTDHGALAPAPPTDRAVAPDGAAGRDRTMADSAARPGTTGPGQPAGVMKAAPPPAPARTPEPSLAASPSPAAPAGRSADSGSPVLNGSASTASQRLLAAAGSGALEAARQALNDGAPVNALDAAGQTPLMLAVRHGDEAMVRLLLAAGADRTRTDAAGLTAADHARRAGQATLLPLLNATESTPPAPLR